MIRPGEGDSSQKSSFDDLTLSQRLRVYKAFNNRKKWKRFSSCEVCNSKLMAYLDKGHSFEEVIQTLQEKHPDIKNIREYARHAVRSATGLGIWDDWIYEQKFWPLRSPLLTTQLYAGNPDARQVLERLWQSRAKEGHRLIEMDRKAKEMLDRGDEISKLALHAMSRFSLRGDGKA